jgi:hypothetical protein
MVIGGKYSDAAEVAQQASQMEQDAPGPCALDVGAEPLAGIALIYYCIHKALLLVPNSSILS